MFVDDTQAESLRVCVGSEVVAHDILTPDPYVLTVLREAASRRGSVRFHYHHGYKNPGCRFVEIHAVTVRRPRHGRPYYYVTGIQWAGATEGRKSMPDWRTFYAHHVVRACACERLSDAEASDSVSGFGV